MASIHEAKERFEKLFPYDGIDEVVLKNIEKKLRLTLPEDFRQIAEFYSGGLLGDISIFAFDNNTPNILDETIRLRDSINVPTRFLVLAEPPASLIVLDTEVNPAVIWLDNTDVDKLDNKTFITPPDTWDTFSDFFISLIEQEEEERDIE